MTASVELRDIHVSFSSGFNQVKALRGLSLAVEPGEFLTVIGSNGAGKSTLVNVLAGSVAPSSGSVHIAGRDVGRTPEHRRAAYVARVRQDAASSVCPELTVEDNLLLAMKRGQRRSPLRPARSRAKSALARDALETFGTVLKDRLSAQVGLLSGGQRQLVALTMAVCVTPALLLLDEHTSALDPRMAELVMTATDEAVRRHQLTAIMVTHNIGHAARFGDRLAIMNAGRVVAEMGRTECDRLGERGLIDQFRTAVAGDVADSMLA